MMQMEKARLEEARKATKAVKQLAVVSIVVGVFFIVICAFVWGTVMTMEATLPMGGEVAALVEMAKLVALLPGLFGFIFLLNGGVIWYHVAKIEGTLREL